MIFYFNEFSGGALDPSALRNFLKYGYENWSVKPFYVLLLGDGDYDYFDILGYNRNFIPTYQTSYSLHEYNSYATDDFYSRIVGNDKKADLAVGRLNVQTLAEAERVVEKIKKYEQDSERSMWKNRITLLADDNWPTKNKDGSIFTSQSEELATYFIPDHFVIDKLYLAAYPTVITGNGRRKPAVNRAIIDAVNDGTLLFNFIGHGEPDKWCDENVFVAETTIPQLQNSKYFFLTAATCGFGRFDDMENQSATERMVLMEGGAIGAISAIRSVSRGLNPELVKAFFENLLLNPQNGENYIGDAYFYTKQVRIVSNDERFHLFGDPSIKLKLPESDVRIDSLNGKSLLSNIQVKALDDIYLKGTVINSDSTKMGFNGEGIITVYDSDKILQLPEINYQMTVRGGTIFKGRTSIEEGEFDLSFVVPKDISYADKNGKIIAYIYNDEQEALGATSNIIIGGTNNNIVNDGEGPQIEIFFDDFQYEGANLVNSDFTLLVDIEDETGLNTTGAGIGHRLEGILDGDYENTINLSGYFIGDLDSGGKSGKILYRFTNQTVGQHSIKIKAWDVFNNFAEVETEFSVTDSDGIEIENIVNYPNPFNSSTTFTFQHNLNSSIDVDIKIYTIAGRMIKQIEEYGLFDRFVRIPWDGRDGDGNLLANGTYLYKVVLKPESGEKNKSVLGKLSIIR